MSRNRLSSQRKRRKYGCGLALRVCLARSLG
jgi:hypothetical protein